MYQTGLIGEDISRSLSPFIHNTAYDLCHINCSYNLYAITPSELPLLVSQLKNNPQYLGFNITMPYKEIILSYLDEITIEASLCGSVNTIYCKNGLLIGHTTDGEGFLLSLASHSQYLNKHTCIIGNGGACRSLVEALARNGSDRLSIILRRNTSRTSFHDFCQSVSRHYHCPIVCYYSDEPWSYRNELTSCSLVVNATSLGDRLPSADLSFLHSGQLAYDLHYVPSETAFLKFAHSQGALTMNGLEMLLCQAAGSHYCFTNTSLPLTEIRQKLQHHLAAFKDLNN